MIEGFKKFVARGSMVDMAVGIVMGGAVTAIVQAIVNNFINPLIAMIFGKNNINNFLSFTANHSTISFGAIIGAAINFVIIAIAVYFCIVVPINKFRDMSAKRAKDGDKAAAEEVPTDQQTIALLKEIRDQLAIANGTFTDAPASPAANPDATDDFQAENIDTETTTIARTAPRTSSSSNAAQLNHK